MDKERLKRYKEKLEYLDKTFGNLKEWISYIEEKEFISESAVQKRYSIYHAFQIAIEITADLAAMMVKDEQIVPKDDYSNISTLYEKKIIESEICSGLKEANGLRNRIVHDYNGLDDSLAYERILDLMTIFKEFRKEVNKWLRKNS